MKFSGFRTLTLTFRLFLLTLFMTMTAGADDFHLTSNIADRWPGLPDKLDAACYNGKGKAYFFAGSSYWRWDTATNHMDPGYPSAISKGWSGLPNDLDAASEGGVGKGQGKLYFFKGSSYWRWDIAADKLDAGYPKSLNDGWPGLPATKINAAFCMTFEGTVPRIHFFHDGNKMSDWDTTTDTFESTRLPERASLWPSDLDAALMIENRFYIFKQGRCGEDGRLC